MPIRSDRDQSGYYVQWGYHGHKYYYDPNRPRTFIRANTQANAQKRAAYANGYIRAPARGHIVAR
jgi:hypothetical protein